MQLKQVTYLILLLTFFAFVSCKKENKTIKQTAVTFTKEGGLTIYRSKDTTKVVFDIVIADTDFDIQTGLMYRDSMLKKQGMLFVFNDEKERFFYMKNTKIPLDLVFINKKNKIVSFQKEAIPFDESSLPSNAPATYVLEINSGLATELNLSIGDSIHFVEL